MFAASMGAHAALNAEVCAVAIIINYKDMVARTFPIKGCKMAECRILFITLGME